MLIQKGWQNSRGRIHVMFRRPSAFIQRSQAEQLPRLSLLRVAVQGPGRSNTGSVDPAALSRDSGRKWRPQRGLSPLAIHQVLNWTRPNVLFSAKAPEPATLRGIKQSLHVPTHAPTLGGESIRLAKPGALSGLQRERRERARAERVRRQVRLASEETGPANSGSRLATGNGPDLGGQSPP